MVTINKEQVEAIQGKLTALKLEVMDTLVFAKKAWNLLDFDENGDATLTQEQKDALLTAYATHKNDMQAAYNDLP